MKKNLNLEETYEKLENLHGEALYNYYRKLGMSEEAINEIRKYDIQERKGDKEYHKHTCPLETLDSKRR